MKKITPFLWFNNNAEEAMNFYTSIFKNSKIINKNYLPDKKMMAGTFEIDGQQFHVLNGGPVFHFTEAISLFINCETQEEVDELWEKLSEGGSRGQCGWLKDKFGLSWQVIPSALGKLMSDPDHARAERVMHAMMGMTKIIIADLEKA